VNRPAAAGAWHPHQLQVPANSVGEDCQHFTGLHRWIGFDFLVGSDYQEKAAVRC